MPVPATPTSFTVAKSAIQQFTMGALSNKTELVFTWGSADGTAIYQLDQAAASGGPWTQVAVTGLGGSTLTLSNLANNTHLWFRIRGLNSSGYSVAYATTDLVTPALATSGSPPT